MTSSAYFAPSLAAPVTLPTTGIIEAAERAAMA
jgi:hypothetical protein